MEEQLKEIKRQVDKLHEKLDLVITSSSVHSAVCDADRTQIRNQVDKNSAKLWKIIIALVGSGILGGGIVSVVEAFVK